MGSRSGEGWQVTYEIIEALALQIVLLAIGLRVILWIVSIYE